MISGRVDDGNPVVSQPAGFLEEEALGLKRQALAVEKIASDQKGVHVLPDRQIHRTSKRFSGGVAQAPSDRLGSAGKRGIEVDVGNVQESHEPT